MSIELRQVGLVGLGDQGTPIAQRLLSKGWRLAFFARRPDVCQTFTALGANSMALRDVAATSDLMLVIVVDDAQVREVVMRDGILESLRPNSILVIHSTVRPEACEAIGKVARTRQIHVLDAPVSGGRDRSYAGDLTLLVGGDEEALAAARPAFSAYASLIVHMGPLGAGQKAKLLNNYFYAAHLATASKMIELVTALGIDRSAAAQALPSCSGASAALAIQAARGFERTRHDKGSAHALSILSRAVDDLRTMASAAGVQLESIDRLINQALADEANRARDEARAAERTLERPPVE